MMSDHTWALPVELPQGHNIAATEKVLNPPQQPPPLPEWADDTAVNFINHFTWGAKQYVACVQIEQAVAHVMIDTGGHASVIDLALAEAMGFEVVLAKDTECGTYQSPGYPP